MRCEVLYHRDADWLVGSVFGGIGEVTCRALSDEKVVGGDSWRVE